MFENEFMTALSIWSKRLIDKKLTLVLPFFIKKFPFLIPNACAVRY